MKHKVQAAKEERDTLSAEQQQLLKEKSKLELTIKVATIFFSFTVLLLNHSYNCRISAMKYKAITNRKKEPNESYIACTKRSLKKKVNWSASSPSTKR